eukprot:3537640-Rhodomonas_salina.1
MHPYKRMRLVSAALPHRTEPHANQPTIILFRFKLCARWPFRADEGAVPEYISLVSRDACGAASRFGDFCTGNVPCDASIAPACAVDSLGKRAETVTADKSCKAFRLAELSSESSAEALRPRTAGHDRALPGVQTTLTPFKPPTKASEI